MQSDAPPRSPLTVVQRSRLDVGCIKSALVRLGIACLTLVKLVSGFFIKSITRGSRTLIKRVRDISYGPCSLATFGNTQCALLPQPVQATVRCSVDHLLLLKGTVVHVQLELRDCSPIVAFSTSDVGLWASSSCHEPTCFLLLEAGDHQGGCYQTALSDAALTSVPTGPTATYHLVNVE
jgi:hypothetical protein